MHNHANSHILESGPNRSELSQGGCSEGKPQKQAQLQRFTTNKFVGLLNTGNLCYLNSTMQVLFNMPLLCEKVIDFFKDKDSAELNQTSA